MSFESDFAKELPEETLAIATAIAERSVRDGHPLASITAEVYEIPIKAISAEEEMRLKLGHTMLLLARVEDPSIPVPQREQLDATLPEGLWGNMADEATHGSEVTINPYDMKNMFHFINDEMQKLVGPNDEAEAELFTRRLTSAREISIEQGVPMTQVYQEDELYIECLRRASTPEEHVATHEASVVAVSEDAFTNIALKFLSNALPKELTEQLEPDQMLHAAMRMQLDATSQEKLTSLVEKSRELKRQTFLYEHVRIWGKGALERLAPKQLEILMPRQLWATPVREIMSR